MAGSGLDTGVGTGAATGADTGGNVADDETTCCGFSAGACLRKPVGPLVSSVPVDVGGPRGARMTSCTGMEVDLQLVLLLDLVWFGALSSVDEAAAVLQLDSFACGCT